RSLTMNQALADMLGYYSSEEAAGELINNFQQAYVDPETYREVMNALRQHGSIKSFEAQLYRKDKSLIWANMSITAVKDTAGNLLYYHGIVEDISPQKKLEQERQNSIDNLRKSLGATIKALSAITEARDPYTAGHQKRVADLARTIATEMGLSSDRIDGIRLAGMIHDLGKIVIPSEILTKPTKLTNLEMEIIKTHAQAGYDILKDIEFPWPIARMVHEHHERIDGSGYPQRLKGDDILLESKIIAVADVVEAISSYRPYRPALGIGTALEEIESKSGILYDQTVSRICLRLFREKHYSMPK
ncbi:MAG: HD-GYP domain-containing protein, partial [Smithellaceae bacterium]